MKKYGYTALALLLVISLLAGCRSKKADDTTVPHVTTTAPTTQATTPPATTMPRPTTQPTQPSADTTESTMDELIPDTGDTVDPTNGANQPKFRPRNGGRSQY